MAKLTVTGTSEAAERVTVKTNSVVPELPSFLDTSPMLIRGSSSTMVPTPWPSAMTAPPVALAQVDHERLVRLADPVAVDQHRDRLASSRRGRR